MIRQAPNDTGIIEVDVASGHSSGCLLLNTHFLRTVARDCFSGKYSGHIAAGDTAPLLGNECDWQRLYSAGMPEKCTKP
jgi:hypothetical protein